MKNLLLILLILPLFLFGQSDPVSTQSVSSDNTDIYEIFPTSNMYNFIKLNTRNGQMWQVQWGTESKYRFETTLSEMKRVDKEDEVNGRFTLYPTTNNYNLILLDQIDGRTWQVQWAIDAIDRMVLRIY